MHRIALAILTSVSVAHAEVRPFVIDNDPGGYVSTYEDLYRRLAASGVPVVLEGECDSACTIVLHLPPEQVCATPKATLGFHNVTGPHGIVDKRMTRQFAHDFYPPAVRTWFLRQRFDRRNDVKIVPATTMGVRPCP